MALPLAALKLDTGQEHVRRDEDLHHGIAACGIETFLSVMYSPVTLYLHHGIAACGIET